MQVKRSPASTCRVEPQQCSKKVSSTSEAQSDKSGNGGELATGRLLQAGPIRATLYLSTGISGAPTWLKESASWLMELRSTGVGSATKPLLEPVPHCTQAARQQRRGSEGRRQWRPGSEMLQARHSWDGSGGRARHTGRQVAPSASGCQLRTRPSLLCCLAWPAELSPQHSTARQGGQWACRQEDQLSTGMPGMLPCTNCRPTGPASAGLKHAATAQLNNTSPHPRCRLCARTCAHSQPTAVTSGGCPE